MKCPHCGATIVPKGHVRGTKGFRELSPAQQRAAIAKTTRDVKAMGAIYRAGQGSR
jgi:hypothetical protein